MSAHACLTPVPRDPTPSSGLHKALHTRCTSSITPTQPGQHSEFKASLGYRKKKKAERGAEGEGRGGAKKKKRWATGSP